MRFQLESVLQQRPQHWSHHDGPLRGPFRSRFNIVRFAVDPAGTSADVCGISGMVIHQGIIHAPDTCIREIDNPAQRYAVDCDSTWRKSRFLSPFIADPEVVIVTRPDGSDSGFLPSVGAADVWMRATISKGERVISSRTDIAHAIPTDMAPARPRHCRLSSSAWIRFDRSCRFAIARIGYWIQPRAAGPATPVDPRKPRARRDALRRRRTRVPLPK